jgi:hypothetical protein
MLVNHNKLAINTKKTRFRTITGDNVLSLPFISMNEVK